MVRPHSLISLGAVVAKLLMSANSKKYANDSATSMTLWKRAIGSRSRRFAALECCMSGFPSLDGDRSVAFVGPVQAQGVGDQELLALFGRDGHVRHVVDKEPVVGHVVGEVGVGPVGAPQHPVGELRH